ncbi:hypothetical protein ACIBI0_38820 [Microbispora rosea]
MAKIETVQFTCNHCGGTGRIAKNTAPGTVIKHSAEAGGCGQKTVIL